MKEKKTKEKRPPIEIVPAKQRSEEALNKGSVVKIFNLICLISAICLIAFWVLFALFSQEESLYLALLCIAILSTVVFLATLPLIRKYSTILGYIIANIWKKLENRWPTLFEFIRFWLVSNVTTIIDYAITFFLLWVVFSELQYKEFDCKIGEFTLFHYDAGKGMGLAGFLSYVISYIISQIFNFFAQRKIAFKANNSVVKSAIWYTVVTLVVVFITQFLPQFYLNWLYGLVGSEIGSLLVKFVNCCIGMWAMYPINKFIIMTKTDKSTENEALKAKKDESTN